MFTYGYIKEATLAHLDIDEKEANDMNLSNRFYIYANEAMQAICASKPKYKYLDITVVREFAPLVSKGGDFSIATEDELKRIAKGDTTIEVGDDEVALKLVDDENAIRDYYNNLGIYKVGQKYKPTDELFIAYASKQVYKIETEVPAFDSELFLSSDENIRPQKDDERFKIAIKELDYTYLGGNEIKFYKPGEYFIPARFMWYRFVSNEDGQQNKDEIDMPADILLTIPLYIASICLQIDNATRANIKRQEFEMALSRCINTDFMPLPKIKGSW